MGLLERAEKLTDEVQRALAGPGAMLVPQPVRAVIPQIVRLMEDLAREIEKGKS